MNEQLEEEPPRGSILERPAALAQATFIVVAVLSLWALIWWLNHVVLLAFAAVIVATILVSVSTFLHRWTPLRERWALALAVLLILIFVGSFIFLLGAQIRGQLETLLTALPQMVTDLGDQFDIEGLYDRLVAQLQAWVQTSSAIQGVFGVTFGIFGVIADLVVVIAAGIYLAARPAYHKEGVLKLFPKRARGRLEVAADEAGRALKLWLIGQVIAMLLVGTLTTLGLTFIGVPSALALGFIAGIAEFIPMVGPFLSAIPALLVGLSSGWTTMLWVAAVFVIVQQIEGNLITPLIQRRAVDMPPVLALFALIALGSLFGPLGVLLATPLAVVLLVFVKQLYIRDTLHEATPIPGERKTVPADVLEEAVEDVAAPRRRTLRRARIARARTPRQGGDG